MCLASFDIVLLSPLFQRPGPGGHIGQKVQARSAVPFAVKLLIGFQVDGTWNVPTTLIPGGRHMECAYYFDF
jgi:hypothetical protein